MIQGSIYYGCAFVSLPAGRIAETYGATRVFGAMVAVGCLLCLVSPVAAQASTSLFVALRVMQGVAVGGLFPALNTLLVKWIPSEEISKVFSITHTGINLGSVTCMALAGWLCEMEWLGGWPLPFYMVGAAGLVWYALWFLLVHPTPEEHPRITQKELQYILDGRRRAGVIAALPYLLSCLVSVGWGHVIGYLTAAHILTTRRIRQLSTGIVECDAHASVTLLVVCVCIGTCNYTGHFSSMQDLSPTFCGTLMGFVSIFSSLSGMAGPLVTGLIINENQTLGAWRSVFITSAIVSIVCSTTYILFTPVQRQHWDTAASELS
ncbi:Sialin [Chionoecetes opilio]|uniref:Sialin n=1 Tax=Chionoecetes opilio TaxID=41210 RepID=A0A8J4YFV3_CHIOP|nr:Sialin [Chionoecetes opilio]